jgi:hypothetical protein
MKPVLKGKNYSASVANLIPVLRDTDKIISEDDSLFLPN